MTFSFGRSRDPGLEVSELFRVRGAAKFLIHSGALTVYFDNGSILAVPVRGNLNRSFRRLRLVLRVRSTLDVWAAILPARIVNEDLGDYLEDIHRRFAAGQHWRVWLRMVTAIFWTGLNAVGYAMKLVGMRRAR